MGMGIQLRKGETAAKVVGQTTGRGSSTCSWLTLETAAPALPIPNGALIAQGGPRMRRSWWGGVWLLRGALDSSGQLGGVSPLPALLGRMDMEARAAERPGLVRRVGKHAPET